jgi:hypothetical protein
MVAGQQQAANQAGDGGGDRGPEDGQNPLRDGLVKLQDHVRRQLGLNIRPENAVGAPADLVE